MCVDPTVLRRPVLCVRLFSTLYRHCVIAHNCAACQTTPMLFTQTCTIAQTGLRCLWCGVLSLAARALCVLKACVHVRAVEHAPRACALCASRVCACVLVRTVRYLFARKRVDVEMVFRSFTGLWECWNPGNIVCVCVRACVCVCVFVCVCVCVCVFVCVV